MVLNDRTRVVLVCVAFCLLSTKPASAFGPVPVPRFAPVPACPEYLIGQIDGCYYYATSDCRGLTGYGQSGELIPLPQCSEGMCGRTVSTPGGNPDIPLNIDQAEIDGWIKSIKETREQLAKEIRIRATNDTRLVDLNEILAKADATLNQLQSKMDSSAKYLANQEFNKAYGDFIRDTSRVGFADGHTIKLSIADRPLRRAVMMQQGQAEGGQPLAKGVSQSLLKAAEEIQFDTAGVTEQNAKSTVARFASVKAEKDDLVSLEIAPGQVVCFQCFRIMIRKTTGSPNETLFVGVQVSPSNSAKKGSFSERGNYAHRIKNSRGTPFLVNSYDDLGAK